MPLHLDAKEKTLWQQGIGLFGEVTGLIVVPIIAALYGGRALDQKFESEPTFFFGLAALAICISTLSVIRIAMRYMKEIDQASHVRNDRKPGDRNDD